MNALSFLPFGSFVLVIGAFLISMLKKKRELKILNKVTPSTRGTKSERDLVLKLLKSGRSPKALYHDLYIEKPNRGYSQIDLVLATAVGLIIFEVKEYTGWIFGNGGHSKWTQVLSYGNQKHRFYNPIKQNQAHIKALKSRLGLEGNVPYFSVIVFYGNCLLKDISFIPEGTYLVKPRRVLEVVGHIEEISPAADYRDKRQVIRILEDAVRIGDNKRIQKDHINNIKNLLGIHRIYD